MNKFNKGFIPLIVIIIIVAIISVGGSVAYYTAKTQPTDQIPLDQNEQNDQQQKPTACTQEAKICPNGSAVGRTGPNCEFAPCPDSKADETDCSICRDSDGGKNYHVLGSTNPCSSADGSTSVCPPCGAWIDKCLDSNILLEYSCENLGGERYNCTNGCKNGACL